jgi:hypothetical protein
MYNTTKKDQMVDKMRLMHAINTAAAAVLQHTTRLLLLCIYTLQNAPMHTQYDFKMNSPDTIHQTSPCKCVCV